MIIALTGGTGFVGSHLIDLALAHGHRVRALTRRPQPAREGIAWVEGALDTPDALAELARGADALIHVAGVVNADRDTFARGNIAGTQAVVEAAQAAGVGRFVHVSSLAAREPDLSIYGWSKAGAENAVFASPLDWTIVRPPAIYGPGDMDMREVFRMAAMGIALMPPSGRMAIIHVDDFARLLLALAADDPGRLVLEADDGTPGGWTHADFARAVGAAVGRRVLPVALPRPILSVAARLDQLFRGRGARLTPDRVGYMCHPDWTCDPAKAPPPSLWRPAIAAADGLAQTAAWYRANRLL